MATYYVRPDGNDSNTGLGSSVNQGWRTIQKALGPTGVGSGDTVYIAPGLYNEQITIGGTYSTTTTIAGDPTATQFAGINAGRVQVGSFTTLGGASSYSGSTIVGTSKNNLSFSNIEFLLTPAGGGNAGVRFITSQNISFNRCVFQSQIAVGAILFSVTPPTSSAFNLSVTNCVFSGSYANSRCIELSGQSQSADTTSIKNCLFIGAQNGIYVENTKLSAINCTFIGQTSIATYIGTAVSFAIQNCLFYGCLTACSSVSAGIMTQTYCRFVGNNTNLNNVATSVTSSINGTTGFDNGYQLLSGLNPIQFFSTFSNSPNTSFGNATNADATDLYGVVWSGSSPDVGCATFRNIGSVGVYLPTERNQSSVEITAGQTSRSLYIYLGATGLTATTTGLQAYYTKEDASPVSIPLVAQTTTGAWVSGGFAEVSAANQPGVYRLDIPNAAISAGYNQTVVTVRGASGTNGAVVVIQEPPVLGSQVRMGPFTVQADGVLTDERLKLYKGSIHSIDFKMVDQYSTGVDGTGTVVTANVYNSAGFLVDSYPCTAKYAEDGRYSFAIDATVTNVVGMYTINISRQIGSEINVFGRMKLEVLSP